MNLNHYAVFLEVADKGNFSKAGKELFLSQPAVSQMMSQLEEDVNCKLFIRQSRGVILTREGQEFYKLVKLGMLKLEEANERMKEMKQLDWGALRLGASDTISRYILPKHLKEFTNKYPKIRVSIRNGTSKELENMLDNGEIDTVIGFKPNNKIDYKFYKLMTLHEVFVASMEYSKTIPNVLTRNNIDDIKIMLLDEKSQTRKEINAHLLMQNITLNPEVELANYELLAEFAKQGLGVAILSKELIKGLKVIKSEIDLPTRDVGLYHLNKIPLSYAAENFVNSLVK